MASVKLFLDKRSMKKDGTYPLKLTVHHRKSFHISLNVSVLEQNWINDKIVGVKNERFLNSYIQSRFATIHSTLLKLKVDGSLGRLSHLDLKRILMVEMDGGVSNKEDSSNNKLLFVSHAKQFISTRDAEGTKETYNYTLDTIKKHYDLNNLLFEDIDIFWLEDFNGKLQSTCSINTRSIHLRNVRAIFRDAMRKKLVSKELYPFDDFSIKTEETMHRDLAPEDLKMLRDYDVEPHQEQYRDLFMLLFYLIGINTTDLVHAESIDRNRLNFRRAKTGRLYSIKVQPEALAIIEKYSPGQKYLLNFLDNYSDYKNFRGRFNKNLKEIGPWEWVHGVSENGRGIKKKKIKPLFPFLTSYYARHTWATIAGLLDIPDKTIKMALGHGKKTTMDIYVNFDMRKVDAANRKVIDYLNNL